MPNSSWNEVASWYDKHLNDDKNNYHQTLIIPKIKKTLINYLKPKSKVIDLACGQGLITKEMALTGNEIVGVDISPNLIRIAKANSKIDFKVGNVTDFKFISDNYKKNSFDALTCFLAIQNIESLNGFVKTCRFLVKDNSYIFVLLNHPYFRIPKQTEWGYEKNEKMYRKVFQYKSEMKIPIVMQPGKEALSRNSEVTYSYHRPLEKYINEFAEGGFGLVNMEELVSNRESQPGVRAKAENTSRKEIPLFMLLVFKKI